MKWVIKQKHLSNLFDFAKKNLNTENYIFITTNEIFSEQKDNFNIFCKKIPHNYTVEGLIEKTEKNFKSGIVVFNIKKEFILEDEIAFFGLDIKKNSSSIILLPNSLDYEYSRNKSNKHELLWFVKKIHGVKPKLQDHFAVKTEIPNLYSQNIRGVQSAMSNIRYSPHIGKGRRPSSDFFRERGVTCSANLDLAKSLFSISIKLEPENFMAHYELGLLFFRKESFTAALDCFKKCQQANPNFSYSKKMKAECYFALGMSSLAIAEYDDIDIEKQPDAEKLDMKLHLAMYKTFTQDYDEAISLYEEVNYDRKTASDTWPDFLPSFFDSWIFSLQKTERVNDEIRVLKLALDELESTTYDVAYGKFAHDLALCYLKLEQIENSINICKNTLKKDPQIWPVLLVYALCFLEKDEPENAISNLKSAKIFIEKEPSSPTRDFWLNSVNELITIIDLGIDEINIKEQIEKIPSKIETDWELKLKDLGAVNFTSSKEQNNEIVLTKLCKCEGYLFWVDPYFESPGLKWLSQAYIEKNSSIEKIEILAKFTEFNPKEEVYQNKFKELFNQLKTEVNKKNITLELRICFESEFAKKIHARYWYFHKIPPPKLVSAWSIPSIMNIKRGQNESINPTVFPKQNFDEIWEHSLNFETDYDEIISKYEEWRKRHQNES